MCTSLHIPPPLNPPDNRVEVYLQLDVVQLYRLIPVIITFIYSGIVIGEPMGMYAMDSCPNSAAEESNT